MMTQDCLPAGFSRTAQQEVNDSLAAANGRMLQRIALLESELNDALEFIEKYVDVVDGDYGEPAPNRAMTLATNIREALGSEEAERRERIRPGAGG